MNTRSCKWNQEKNNLCANFKKKLETRNHIFQACSTTKDLIAFLKIILNNVGHLQSGNTKYLFLYEMYKANSMENLSLIFFMKYINNSKFNSAYSYRQLNFLMVEMNQKSLGKAAEVVLLLNKELWI